MAATTSTLLLLPVVDFTVKDTKSVAAASTLNSAADSASKSQVSLSAYNAPLPVIYGSPRVGGLIANLIATKTYGYIQVVWGSGPIQSVDAIYQNETLIPSADIHNYTGSSGQTADPWLVSAFATNGISYTDTLPNIAYSVIRFSVSVEDFDVNSIVGELKGRLLYDPRTSLTTYSDNPSLILADYLSSKRYGVGRTVNWFSVIACANANDELVGGVKRRTLSIAIKDRQPHETWVEVLRTYAACFVNFRTEGYTLTPDRPIAVTAHYDHSQGQIHLLDPIEKRSRRDLPNVVKVIWTNTSSKPYVDDYAYARLPGVINDTVEPLESEVRLPGITNASQAVREAEERLNKLTVSDASTGITVFDEGIVIEVGDVVAITHPRGLSYKQFRAMQVTLQGGLYTLKCSEYDVAAYSNTVVTSPTTPDTALPNPNAPEAVTNLAVSEEVFQLLNGEWSSRLRVTWDPPATFPWVSGYKVDVSRGVTVLASAMTSAYDRDWSSPSVAEKLAYTVKVYAVTRTGAQSAPVSTTITAQGKFLPPGNVPSISGFEVGGEVRLVIGAATDKDMLGYEVRYVAVGGTWEAATFVNFVPAASGVGGRVVSKDVPAGAFDFLCCAIDSIGQYSLTPARVTITVTNDAAAFLVDSHEFVTPNLVGMAEIRLSRTDTVRRFVTEGDATFASKFTNVLSTYVNPVSAYGGAVSSFTSETWDFGLALAGNWMGSIDVENLSGTATKSLNLATAAFTGPFTPYNDLVAKTSARYVRLSASTTGVMLVTFVNSVVRIDAVARKESSTAFVTSSATVGTRVTLEGSYTSFKGAPSITVIGSSPATVTIDNVVAGPVTYFDVYIFNPSTNVQISRQFGWSADVI